MSQDALLSVNDPFNTWSPHAEEGTFGGTSGTRSMTYDLQHGKATGSLRFSDMVRSMPLLSARISTGRNQSLSSLTLDLKKWAV